MVDLQADRSLTMPDRDDLRGTRQPVPPYQSSSRDALGGPPGDNKDLDLQNLQEKIKMENEDHLPEDMRGQEDEAPKPKRDFLRLFRVARDQGQQYQTRVNRAPWSENYRAFHNQHWSRSRYNKKEWKYRSKFFRPKTRSAVRKDLAAVSASLFGSVAAINCEAGNEGDPHQRGAAAVMEELINYRTDRTNGEVAIPWPAVAMGARQNSNITGVCVSKQTWKTEYRRVQEEPEVVDMVENEEGVYEKRTSYVYEVTTNRPDSILIPSENVIIAPGADWTNPAQSAQYLIIQWPMTLEEIRAKQNAPINPWIKVDEETLRSGASDSGTFETAAVRRARELGQDRFEDIQAGKEFETIWVHETFFKIDGDDWTFYSVGDKAYLTEPRPVRDVYPEQGGERPITFGYGSFEAHRIFPMSQVESLQPMQREINDFANLIMDALKQNVMPVARIVRAGQVDLDQVRNRSSGSAIMMNKADDVTFEKVQSMDQGVTQITRELELSFDDLAGQFNGETAQNNNALSKTLGGLKLVAGTSNTIQEFDIRWWIMTWVEPTLSQIVRLEQFYEDDPIVLGLCGERAQLFQKHGIDTITNDLLEKQVTIRVSAGLGAGDPQMRLQKFAQATQIAAPLIAQSPEWQSGEYTMDWEAVMEEVYGAAGYRDGGRRFVKKGQPKPNPMGDLPQQKLQSEIEKNKAMAKGSILNGLAAVAKVALGKRELEAWTVNMLLDNHMRATDLGHQHAHGIHDRHLSAIEHGHRHGLAIAEHRRGITQDQHGRKMAETDADIRARTAEAKAAGENGKGGKGGKGGKKPVAKPAPQEVMPPEEAAPQQAQQRPIRYDFIYGPNGRISGAKPVYADAQA